MNRNDLRRLQAMRAELAILEARYRGVINAPGETTRLVPAAMKQWGSRIAILKHEIRKLDPDSTRLK